MCGDLEDYDPEIHAELLLNGIEKHIGLPLIPPTNNWAKDVANLELLTANKELLAQYQAMGSAVCRQRSGSDRLESIAQLAQIHAYLSGILTGLLLDDGSLQQIGIRKFLEGFSTGRSIDQEVSSMVTHDHQGTYTSMHL